MHRFLFLFAGQGGAALLIMARNLLLARMIGAEGYGAAMVLVVSLSVVELVTTLGLPQQIASQPKGASVPMQATMHGVQLVRGLLCGLCLLLAAAPIARFLNTPELAGLLALSAVSPVLLGLCHLDAFRAQRHRRHSAQIALLVVPAGLSALSLWPLQVWLDGAQLMLGLIGVHSLSQLGLSHLVARRGYDVRVTSKQALTCVKYGFPLAGNGVVLAFVLHYEKAVSGHFFDLETLALLAMGAALTMTPALTAARSFQGFHLPVLRRAPDISAQVMARACNLGAGLAIALALLAPWVLGALGPSFAPAVALLPFLVVLAALRLPKSGLATIAMAQGRTMVPLVANLPRLASVPIIWSVASGGGSVLDILLIAAIAEALGLVAGILASFKALRLPYPELGIFALTCLLVALGQAGSAVILLVLFWVQDGLGRYARSLKMRVAQ